MIDQGYGQMHPIYEAMSVCRHIIEWLNHQERERTDWELYVNLGTLERALQHFTDACGGGKLAQDASRALLAFSVLSLSAVTSMTGLIVGRIRENLPRIGERFSNPTEFLLDQVDELTERIEDIAEAWEIPLDESLSAKLNAAVELVDRSKTDIPEWREALEFVPD